MRATNFISNIGTTFGKRAQNQATTTVGSQIGAKSRAKLETLGKKLVALAVSYELISYALATVQAVGLTLPAIVSGGPAQVRYRNEQNMQNLLSAAQQWQTAQSADARRMPTLDDLKGKNGAVPSCEGGCHFEIVQPGNTMKAQNGQFCLVPEGRIAIQSVVDKDPSASYGILSNPYN